MRNRSAYSRFALLSNWLMAVILTLGLAIAAPKASAQSGAVVRIVPANSTVNVGGTVVVNVRIENVRNLARAEVHILYDPFLLEAQIEPGGFPAPDIVMQSSATGGRIDFDVAQMPQRPPVSDSGVLLKVTFKGLAPGTSVLHITSAILSDGSGALIPSTTHEGSVTVILGSISGIVLRQGVLPSTGPGTPACTQITATIGEIWVHPPVYTDAAGYFELPITSAGRYTVRAAYPGYLNAEKANVFASAGQALIGTTRLFGGDVNGDCVINIQDIVLIIINWGRTGVEIRSDPPDCNDPDNPYDINDDGSVNISDLAIVAGNFGRTCPTTWAP